MMTVAPPIPKRWLKLFALLPGYDPIATAAPGDWFDVEDADKAVAFFAECLHLFEGVEGGDQPFKLEPWQAAIVGCLFGWKREDGARRYREAFIYVPRKNGKTPLIAGMLCYVMFCDGEPGAQLYSAAAEREQAALVYRHAVAMILREPMLSDRADIHKSFKSIEVPATQSIYKALSADADTKHGFNSHFVAVDELHAHPNRHLVDVLHTSTGSRRQPLVVYITTADFDRESICNEKYDYAKKICDGTFENRQFLPVIYEAAADDDWKSPATWAKANPNLGVSVKEDWLAAECQRAQDQPSYENTFKRLHLNVRTQQDIRWLAMDKWDACGGAIDLALLERKPCYAGVDLANKQDIAACVLVFPESGAWLPFFWVPRDMAMERDKRDRVPYMQWAREGHIELTDGNVIDHGFIRKRLVELKKQYDIKEVGYDPWHATQFAIQLQDSDGFNMVEFRQGAVSMNEPCRELERQIASKAMRHGGNPVLRWMAGNVSAHVNSGGLIRPDKQKSTEKIDGIVAGLMALGLSMRAHAKPESVYKTRGILSI